MNAATFLAAIRRRTRFTSAHRDPLVAAWRYLDEYGESAEAQALRKAIKALAVKDGEFSESEVWLFSTEAITLVAALIDARLEGRYPELDWWVVV
ncbi:MAG: hypothetical protein IH606_20170 [Burkholderiales bacterium]|nr:hypothetical protein [Burkholderiales bacterium]